MKINSWVLDQKKNKDFSNFSKLMRIRAWRTQVYTSSNQQSNPDSKFLLFGDEKENHLDRGYRNTVQVKVRPASSKSAPFSPQRQGICSHASGIMKAWVEALALFTGRCTGVPAGGLWVKNLTAVAPIAVEVQVWSPAWCSGLRIWHCCRCSIECRCVLDSVPGWRTSICRRCSH